MLNYVMFMLNSNEPIKVLHLQKLANPSSLSVKARKYLVI